MTGEDNNNMITPTEAEHVDPIAIYQNNIYALVDDLKQDDQFKGLSDRELKEDKAFFPRLIQYIYNNYLGDLLGNKDHKVIIYKDIKQLDYIFNIYIDLVYKYKWNNRPLIVEYAILTGINRDSIYNWINGVDNNISTNEAGEYLTRERSETARKWVEVCERALIDGSDTIKDIFILKSKHGYRDNANDINITVNHKAVISADDLPALIGLNSNN